MRLPLHRRARRLLAGAFALTTALAACTDEEGGLTLGRPFADRVEAVSGSGQSVAAGSPAAEPFVVRVLDQARNPMVGAPVSFAITAGGGSLSATRTTTDASGLATVTYTAGTATGPATITATAAELRPVTFQATITPAVATPTAILTILGGNNQSVRVGARVAVPLTVRLATATGTPVVGTTVTWVITTGGGSVSAATATTDASGNASTLYTAGATAGTATITALAPGATPVVFSETITAATSG